MDGPIYNLYTPIYICTLYVLRTENYNNGSYWHKSLSSIFVKSDKIWKIRLFKK